LTKIFGTDGIRGIANTELSPELAFRVGRAGAAVLAERSDRHKPVIVARDTRLSGTMLEAAILAGITSVGRDAVAIGIVPTPAVAMVTVGTGAAAGCMISASHNPIADNGIKFFGPDGFKLSDALEAEIEARLNSAELPRPTGADVGVAKLAQNLASHYYDALYAQAADLSGLTVVVDAAYGAAYAIAPYVLKKMGATVHEMHCEADGSRINVRCGATDLRALAARVRDLIASGNRRVIGVAFDGDADRALFVDETGTVLTGDHIMFVLANVLHDAGMLPGDAVVGTVMSNIGLRRALETHGIKLLRAPVGDRYVLEHMRAGGYLFGGEQSGHIIDLHRNTTGDGPMTAVAVLGTIVKSGATLHELCAEMHVFPQVLVNVKTSNKGALDSPMVARCVTKVEQQLGESGRLLVRASGTEPLIRVMIEGEDRTQIEALANGLAAEIERAAG